MDWREPLIFDAYFHCSRPDDRSGEVGAVYVVRRDAALTAEAVIAHCRTGLTRYKEPREIHSARAAEVSLGQYLRRVLREEASVAR